MSYNNDGGDKKRWTDFNRLEVSGRVGRDPEYKFTNAGKEYAQFVIAMNEAGPGGAEKTTWLNVSLMGQGAVAKAHDMNLSKGDPVKLRGRLEIREYDGRDGVRQKWVSILAFEIAGVREQLSSDRGGRGDDAPPRDDSRREDPQRAERREDRREEPRRDERRDTQRTGTGAQHRTETRGGGGQRRETTYNPPDDDSGIPF